MFLKLLSKDSLYANLYFWGISLVIWGFPRQPQAVICRAWIRGKLTRLAVSDQSDFEVHLHLEKVTVKKVTKLTKEGKLHSMALRRFFFYKTKSIWIKSLNFGINPLVNYLKA